MHERLRDLCAEPRRAVVICGGAVSGSEAAALCAARGVSAIVFEQNARPYGKIEDGLPRWHDKLRAKEYARIDRNLATGGVYFVPRTRVGRDLSFETVSRDLGASAVLLASGAWRDRPLPVQDADRYVERGLVYQNPFVYWFNHYEEPDYAGPHYAVADDAIVVGGGLASIDVVKIINIELYRSALRARGIDVSVVEMEHRGIAGTLQHHGLARGALAVRGCTLYYRRRVRDMPLAFARPNATAEQLEKIAAVREKMVRILADKFFVKVEPSSTPAQAIVEDDRMVGLTFRRTELQNGKLIEVHGSERDVRAGLIVSSIGSVPEPLSGVPHKGELYDYASWDTGALQGLPGVFGLGNVLTGKGNIRDSRENAEVISEQVMRDYLGVDAADRDRGALASAAENAHDAARERARQAVELAAQKEPLQRAALERIARVIEARWNAVGYEGDYRAWIQRHKPFA